MSAKSLLASGVAAIVLSGWQMTAPAHAQAASDGWSSRGPAVNMPVDRTPPHGGNFTPPAPRGDLRGDIAANSRDDRHDRDHPDNTHKPARQ